jgi:hypothetical protein
MTPCKSSTISSAVQGAPLHRSELTIMPFRPILCRGDGMMTPSSSSSGSACNVASMDDVHLALTTDTAGGLNVPSSTYRTVFYLHYTSTRRRRHADQVKARR